MAAGAIHFDFDRGLFRAQIIALDGYALLSRNMGARDADKPSMKGGNQVVKDGEVLHFKFND